MERWLKEMIETGQLTQNELLSVVKMKGLSRSTTEAAARRIKSDNIIEVLKAREKNP